MVADRGVAMTTETTQALDTATMKPRVAVTRVGGFAPGGQAYTFHCFTAFEAIEKTAVTGGVLSENSNEPQGITIWELERRDRKPPFHGILAARTRPRDDFDINPPVLPSSQHVGIWRTRAV